MGRHGRYRAHARTSSGPPLNGAYSDLEESTPPEMPSARSRQLTYPVSDRREPTAKVAELVEFENGGSRNRAGHQVLGGGRVDCCAEDREPLLST